MSDNGVITAWDLCLFFGVMSITLEPLETAK
jgi:hypothetical protein